MAYVQITSTKTTDTLRGHYLWAARTGNIGDLKAKINVSYTCVYIHIYTHTHTHNLKSVPRSKHTPFRLQDTQCAYNLTFRRVRPTIVVEKQLSITYSQCVFAALLIQHAMRMRHIILSSVACPALQHFYTLSHKGHDFREGGELLNTKCVF